MASLESVVLPLEQCKALVEHGVVLDTALMWWHVPDCESSKQYQVQTSMCDFYVPAEIVCPAPVLSELSDAIREKADALEDRINRGMELERHEWDGMVFWEVVGKGNGNCEEDWQQASGEGPTDLLAAYALLLEVSK